MFARSPAVVLKPAARRDLRNILRYGGMAWGAEQANTYRSAIDQALATLTANPRIGRSRDAITPGLRSYGVAQHIIYYRLSGDAVTVLRILHRKMDADQHVAET